MTASETSRGRVTRGILLFVYLLSFTGCQSQESTQQPPIVLKVGQVLPAGHPTSRAMEFFKQRVEALTEGRIDVRLYASGQVGNTNQLIMLSQMGNLEACVVSAAPLAQYAELLNVVAMPFIFRDAEHQYAVVDGPVGEALQAHLRQRQMIGAAFFDSGSRNVMTMQGPIREPADLQGMKIRVMASNVLQLTVQQLGAMPQAISQGEVYSALQTGVIDGWENNPATCRSFSMYETGCTHFAWTRHVAIPDLLVISRRWYDALDSDLQRAIDQAAAETKQVQRELWQQEETEAVAVLQQAGMEFNDVDRAAFERQFGTFYAQFEDRFGPEFSQLLKQIRETQVRSQ
jgi:tripartite ATP-independent transporter DctP family solute receptor